MSNTPSASRAVGKALRSLLETGLPLAPEHVREMAQRLDLEDPFFLPPADADGVMLALQEQLASAHETGDPEAMAMRELALFPDAGLRRQAETLALEHGASRHASFDLEEIAGELAGAEVLLRCNRQKDDPLFLRLVLDPADAAQLAARLRLDKDFPAELADALEALRQDVGGEPFLAMRAALRGARFSWGDTSQGRADFILRLLTGAKEAPRCLKRLPEVLDWALGFAQSAGEDIPRDMTERREELSRQLELAQEVEKVREKHNFETRRMLGIVEPHLEPELVREEMRLLDLAALATGWGLFPMRPQVMEQDLHDLGDLESVEDMQELMHRLGIFGGD